MNLRVSTSVTWQGSNKPPTFLPGANAGSLAGILWFLPVSKKKKKNNCRSQRSGYFLSCSTLRQTPSFLNGSLVSVSWRLLTSFPSCSSPNVERMKLKSDNLRKNPTQHLLKTRKVLGISINLATHGRQPLLDTGSAFSIGVPGGTIFYPICWTAGGRLNKQTKTHGSERHHDSIQPLWRAACVSDPSGLIFNQLEFGAEPCGW